MAQFLSEEWVTQAHEIYDEFSDQAAPATQDVRINLIVKSVPFGDGVVHAHLDTTGGESKIDVGHLEGASTTVTTDYATAKDVFLDHDQSVAMQAFMSGKVQIAGDMTKIMMMMQAPQDPAADQIIARLRAITDA